MTSDTHTVKTHTQQTQTHVVSTYTYGRAQEVCLVFSMTTDKNGNKEIEGNSAGYTGEFM